MYSAKWKHAGFFAVFFLTVFIQGCVLAGNQADPFPQHHRMMMEGSENGTYPQEPVYQGFNVDKAMETFNDRWLQYLLIVLAGTVIIHVLSQDMSRSRQSKKENHDKPKR